MQLNHLTVFESLIEDTGCDSTEFSSWIDVGEEMTVRLFWHGTQAFWEVHN